MTKTDIIIKESEWRTGCEGPTKTGIGLTHLKNEQGFKCCLGFITEQVLGSDVKLVNKNYPEQIPCLIPELTEPAVDYIFCFRDTHLTNQAAKINDNKETTPEEKKVLLIELFKDSCYNLVFTP